MTTCRPVIATLLCALVTSAGSLALGQATLKLCGAPGWSWLAAPVGISELMLLAVPAIYLPGRSVTVAVLIAVLAVCALVWIARTPEHRPPLHGIAGVVPVAVLALMPFLAAGTAGTLGVGLDNDMAVHLLLADSYRSEAIANLHHLAAVYPLGPHALVAALAELLGTSVDSAFAGLMLAFVLILAWTTLTMLKRPSLPSVILVATVVGMPFLVAAYYGEAAFKEVLQALLVLAFALVLGGYGPELGRWRWVPPALLIAGMLSVYSINGLPWPAAFLGFWIVGRAIATGRRAGARAAWLELRAELAPAAMGLGVLLVVLIPQLGRLAQAVGTPLEIANNNIGNLKRPLPGWEGFGIWNGPDFRFGAARPLWTAFVLGLVVLGLVLSLRRGRWMLPVAAATAMLIWGYGSRTQSGYVAAKALVIASPLLMSLAVVPLVELPGGGGRVGRGSLGRGFRSALQISWRIVAPLLALALFVRVFESSYAALRFSPVGPTAHLQELRALRPELHGQSTLFLGNDDFIQWELAGVPVVAPFIEGQLLPMRPQKHWSYGQPFDLDTVDAQLLNNYDWVITTRDAAGSAPPPQLQLVRSTRNFELWHRLGAVPPHAVLVEGSDPGAPLDCRTAFGREVAAGGGDAVVRLAPRTAAGLSVRSGGRASLRIALAAGSWGLEASYESRRPIDVRVLGLRTTLVANLDRPGPRWPIGRLVLSRAASVTIDFDQAKTLFSPSSPNAVIYAVTATPLGTERTMPLRSACGQYVDWYRPQWRSGSGPVSLRPRALRARPAPRTRPLSVPLPPATALRATQGVAPGRGTGRQASTRPP